MSLIQILIMVGWRGKYSLAFDQLMDLLFQFAAFAELGLRDNDCQSLLSKNA